jgi:hypothetical protein
MSSCSRFSWVLPHHWLVRRSLRGVLATARGSVAPVFSRNLRHHAAGLGRRHVCAQRVRDIQAWGGCAPRDPARCRSGRVRRTRHQPGPSRPSLRPPAATHAWRLAPGIRCRSGQVRRCVSHCRVEKPPQTTLPGSRGLSETGIPATGVSACIRRQARSTRRTYAGWPLSTPG